MEVKLLSPSWEHREQCIELLKEWKESEKEIHPGTLRRCPCIQNPIISQSKWLEWLAAEKQQGQNLFFLIREDGRLLGAISIRPQEQGESLWINGHCGYGIRPSERRKGYATRMLRMAVEILQGQGINPVIVTCDQENIASEKTIIHCGGVQVGEIMDPDTGGINRIFVIGDRKKVLKAGRFSSCNQNENVVR